MAAAHSGPDGTAPWVTIPENDITSIEHPCIVKNKIKGIDMLGGAQQLSQSLDQGTQQCLSLTFNPDDPASRTIMSIHNDTSNILLKVTVPRRTGRKRKRGSNEDFVEDIVTTSNGEDASHLLRSLKDNPESSSVEAVGSIKSCHLWRNIPDYVYHTKASSFLRGVESHILPQQYLRLKDWSMPRTYGLEDTETVPPPVFSTQSLSQNYTYRQNPAVKTFADPATGNKMLINRSAPLKLYIQIQMYDDSIYPDAPAPDCPSLEEQSEQTRDLVRKMQGLFEQRPIWIKRAMINALPYDGPTSLVRIAAAYVCYSLRSGPWRDAYVKFGVDPRSDPRYRKYQTILLKLIPNDRGSAQTRGSTQRLWDRSPDKESHIFTGTKPVPVDGKTWQLCDLYDPDLKSLVNVPDLHLRAECETRYFGWYQNGTSAKLRVLLKAKIDALRAQTDLDPAMVQSLLQLPDHWVPQVNTVKSVGPTPGYLPEKSSNKALEWASAYRSICRTSSGSVPKYGSNGIGRLSKRKPTVRPSYIGSERDSDEGNLENNHDSLVQEEERGGEEGERQDDEAAAEYQEPEEEDEDLLGEDDGGTPLDMDLRNSNDIR